MRFGFANLLQARFVSAKVAEPRLATHPELWFSGKTVVIWLHPLTVVGIGTSTPPAFWQGRSRPNLLQAGLLRRSHVVHLVLADTY